MTTLLGILTESLLIASALYWSIMGLIRLGRGKRSAHELRAFPLDVEHWPTTQGSVYWFQTKPPDR